jgi:transcriptional regulator with XRE-family HTH domain
MMISVMPRKRKQNLPPLEISAAPFGNNLAAFRKKQGLTQAELADKVGITQPLISDYERGRLQMSAEMLLRFALALNVSCDVLLGVKDAHINGQKKPSRKVMKRLELIQNLSDHNQRTLLRTIDGFLKGVEAEQ